MRHSINRAKTDAILSRAAERADGLLFEHEVYEFLGVCKIDVPVWHFHPANIPADAVADKLPHAGPFVAKIVARGVTHKMDTGGIRFNVTSDNAPDIVAEFSKKFPNGLEGVLFVEQVEHSPQLGNELLIGLFDDASFGPMVSFGFGGTATEYFKKIMQDGKAQVFLPAGLDITRARKKFLQLPALQILEGSVRGRPGNLIEGEALRVFGIFQELGRVYSPENRDAGFVIEELELNPAVVRNGKLLALDGVLRARRNADTAQHKKPIEKISNLLAPKTVAIAGASGKRANFCNVILKKLLKSGRSKDSIFLIHPGEETIDGIPCFASLSDVAKAHRGKPVDCLIVGVPSRSAGVMVSEAIDSYSAHAILILSAGFGETEAGADLQEELKKKLCALDATPAKRPVINGPNTMGNFYDGTDTMFTASYKSSATGKGKSNAAFICQSGAFLITRLSDMAGIVAPSIGVTVGNQMDLSVADFLDHLLGEKGIGVFALYIEGLGTGDGARLMELVTKARKLGKRVVIYKAGRTEEGVKSAKSHTAAMAGEYEMFKSLLGLAGALVAGTLAEFHDLIMLCSYIGGELEVPLRVGVLSNAGFEKCLIADHLTHSEGRPVSIAKLSDKTRAELANVLEERGVAGIIDQSDILDLSPMMDDEGYDRVMRTILSDKGVDIGIFSAVPETTMLNTCEDISKEEGLMKRIIKMKDEVKKPFVFSIESGRKYDAFAEGLLDAGIPVFRSVDSAARALSKFARE